MQESTEYNNVSKYNNPESGLELSIKNYDTGRIIDPAKIRKFEPMDMKGYTLKIPYSSKKAVNFFTHIDNLEYTVVWVSDNKLEQMVHKLVEMYISIRESYPEQNSDMFSEVSFSFEEKDNLPRYIPSKNKEDEKISDPFGDESFACEKDDNIIKKRIISLYDERTVSDIVEDENVREISFDNEFFNVYIKKVMLENDLKGTKIVFDSNYNCSAWIPAIINQTRADRNREPNKVKFENMQIMAMLRDFLNNYAPLNSMDMASDEYIPHDAIHVYGFSMN